MKILKGGGAIKPPRMVLYGPPGIGKTTFGADAESPVFLVADAGVDSLPVSQTPRCQTWQDVLERLREFATEKHEFKTLVIDTINGVADLAARFICETQFKGDFGDTGFLSFGRGWLATSEEMRKIIPQLDACRDRGMTVLLLAHTGVHNVKNPIDGDYSKFCPDLDRKIWARFAAWADLIFRADFDFIVKNKDQKTNKGRATGETTRIIRTSGSAAEDAKCRVGYELDDELPLSWAAVAANIGKSTAIDEIKSLWAIMPKDDEKKALAYLGIMSVNDIERAAANKVKVLINRLKQRKETTNGDTSSNG